MIGRNYIDARIQTKILKIIANTPLEYGFYSVPYTKEEIDKLEKRNKKKLKQLMKISQCCPSSLLYLPIEKRGMGLRNLWDLYKKINVADLGEMINFHNENSLYHRTSIQRIKDLYKRNQMESRTKNNQRTI
jgi:hypothetical protein